MAQRVMLFVDYQNVYRAARDVFYDTDPQWFREGQFDPRRIGEHLVAASPYDRVLPRWSGGEAAHVAGCELAWPADTEGADDCGDLAVEQLEGLTYGAFATCRQAEGGQTAEAH